MPTDRSDEHEFGVQSLLGDDVTPSSGLSAQAEGRLSVAKRTLDQNYYELESHVDGELPTNPMFICREERKREEGFEVLRLVHNYLRPSTPSTKPLGYSAIDTRQRPSS